jgi:hypothetical protein
MAIFQHWPTFLLFLYVQRVRIPLVLSWPGQPPPHIFAIHFLPSSNPTIIIIFWPSSRVAWPFLPWLPIFTPPPLPPIRCLSWEFFHIGLGWALGKLNLGRLPHKFFGATRQPPYIWKGMPLGKEEKMNVFLSSSFFFLGCFGLISLWKEKYVTANILPFYNFHQFIQTNPSKKSFKTTKRHPPSIQSVHSVGICWWGLTYGWMGGWRIEFPTAAFHPYFHPYFPFQFIPYISYVPRLAFRSRGSPTGWDWHIHPSFPTWPKIQG